VTVKEQSGVTQAAVGGRGRDRPPPGATSALLAAWLLMTEGAMLLVFLPVLIFTTQADIPPGDIATFGASGLACMIAGGLLYSRSQWAWLVALAASIGTAAWLISDKGLTSWTEAYVASFIAVVVTILVLLGRRVVGNPEALALASARIPFRVKVSLVWAAIFVIIGLFLSLSELEGGWMRDNLRFIATGLIFTILLAVCAITLAVVLALVGALGRLSRNPVAYGLSGFYTSFFRGTPLIVQLFLIYFALPQIGSNLDRLSITNVLSLSAFWAGVIGIGLNYGAYMTEIFRAGIQSVGHGQAEAADALAMNYPQRMRRVVLPQATRVIIPPTGNEFIAMMKDTALVSFLGLELSQAELFRRASVAGNQDLNRLESFIMAAGMYWALTAIFTLFQAKLERRMSRGYVRLEPAENSKRPKMLTTAGGQPGVVPLPATVEPGPEAGHDHGSAS